MTFSDRGRAGRRAVVAVVTMAVAFAAAAGPATAGSARFTVLRGTVLPGLSRLSSSPAAPTDHLQLSIALAGRDAAGELDAYRALYEPGSAEYHRFLSPAQIASRFGAPAQRWLGAQRWLRARGLDVGYASATRDLLVVSGSAEAIGRTFGVTLRRYTGGGRTFVANAEAPRVPSALRISAVLGLNTFQRAITTSQRSRRAALDATFEPATDLLSQVLAALGAANTGTQTPQDILGAYEAPASGDTGHGQSVAVLGAGATGQVLEDLRVFEERYGMPRVPAAVTTVGAGPFDDTSGLDEWDLDTQAAVGMAPGLDHLQLYFARDLADASVASLLSAWESDPGAPRQASASFAECIAEPLGDALGRLPGIGTLLSDPASEIGSGLINRLQPVAEDILRKATLQGKTLFAASGDAGSSCPVVHAPGVGGGNGVLPQVVPFTSYPASSPSVTAVGGTVLYTRAGQPPSRALEYGWTFGGGGDAFFVDEPAYQHGVPNLSLPCVAESDGSLANAGKPCRGVPDVAAMSGDVLTNHYPTISNGLPSRGGGTSLSSPLWAGMWSRVQGHAGGAGLGFANETIYRLAKNPVTRDRDFHDVTAGLLGLPVVGNGLYPTQAGWDYVTGWGTPRLSNLIADAGG